MFVDWGLVSQSCKVKVILFQMFNLNSNDMIRRIKWVWHKMKEKEAVKNEQCYFNNIWFMVHLLQLNALRS